nr:acyl carrier protein mitochondrial [Hymenolepis microstoma]
MSIVRPILRAVTISNSVSYITASNRCASVALHAARFSIYNPRRYFSTEDYKESIQNRVMNVCKSYDKLSNSNISFSSDFTKDLGLDSLDHVELIMMVEDEFGLEIPDVEAEKLQTPQCIADMLIKKKEQMMKLDS